MQNKLTYSEHAFTLIELLVALALMALLIPLIVRGLQVATLAGEVSERKALAVRVAERVLNEAILNGPTSYGVAGDEKAGDFQFHWTLKDEPWSQLGSLVSTTSPTGVNQGVVNQNIIHQLSTDVIFAAQGKNYSVHLSTLYNTSTQ